MFSTCFENRSRRNIEGLMVVGVCRKWKVLFQKGANNYKTRKFSPLNLAPENLGYSF